MVGFERKDSPALAEIESSNSPSLAEGARGRVDFTLNLANLVGVNLANL
ncbi:hypothetical protein ACWIUD_10920 [Helicobacter sp. 23-1044]